MASVILGALTLTEQTRTRTGTLGETGVVEGDLLYIDATVNKYKVAQRDGTLAESRVSAIAGAAGTTDDVIVLITGGIVTVTGTLVIATAYFLADEYGTVDSVSPSGGDYISLVGVASSASSLHICISNTEVATT